jgi:hypothetical protein
MHRGVMNASADHGKSRETVTKTLAGGQAIRRDTRRFRRSWLVVTESIVKFGWNPI